LRWGSWEESFRRLLGWQTDFVIDGVGETGAETLPSLHPAVQVSAALLTRENWPSTGSAWATTKEQLHLAESGTPAQLFSRPASAQKKKEDKKKKKKERRAVSCTLIVTSTVSVPRQKAAVSCG
jgi:hypothetical protein